MRSSLKARKGNVYHNRILVSVSLSARYVHTADVLRLLLIYKYGGFYLDSDFVILKSLVGLKNVVASDQVSGTIRQ